MAMTPENISEKLQKQDRQNQAFRNAVKNKGGIGFGDSDSPIEVLEEAIVKGRTVGVDTPEGEKKIEGRVRILRMDGNLVAIPLDNDQNSVIQNIDEAGKIFTEEMQKKTKIALAKSRKKRKENIGAR